MKNSNKALLIIIGVLILLGVYSIFSLKSQIKHAEENTILGNNNIVTETRNLDDFSGLDVVDFFVIEISKGPKQLIIEAEENLIPYILTEVEKDELRLKMDPKAGYKFHTKPVIKITTPELDFLNIHGSSTVSMLDSFYIPEAELNISGSSKSDLWLGAEQLRIGISGSGELKVKGAANYVDFGISGSGTIHSEEFLAKNARVRVSGSGAAHVFAMESIDANVSGSGNVYYYGNPENIISNSSGSGTIQAKK
jgi:hypothetical protein